MLRIITIRIVEYPPGVTGVCLFCNNTGSELIIRTPLPRCLDQYAHERCYHQWVKDYTDKNRKGIIFRDGEQKK